VARIGKSRLLLELSKIADADAGLISWRQGARSLRRRGPLWALAEMVKAQAGILESDTSGQADAKLAEMTADVMPDPPDADWVRRHLGALVGLGGGVSGGGDHRSQAFAAWRHFFEALAERRPLVLVFEDLHWADDGLLDFVDYLPTGRAAYRCSWSVRPGRSYWPGDRGGAAASRMRSLCR
jgi:predicted ATPase